MVSIPDTRLPSRVTLRSSLWVWISRLGFVCCFFCSRIFCATIRDMVSIPDTYALALAGDHPVYLSLWFWVSRRGSVCCSFRCCCVYCAPSVSLLLFLFFRNACARLLARAPGSPACSAAVRWSRCRACTRPGSIPNGVAAKIFFFSIFCVLVSSFSHLNIVSNFFAS